MVKSILHSVSIITIYFLIGCCIKTNYIDRIPIYGVWIPQNSKSGYMNAYTEYGLFKATYDSISIFPTKQKEKFIEDEFSIKDEIGIIHDLGNDLRIVKIAGKYPKYNIKFKKMVSLLNGNNEYYTAWIDGDLYINFNNYNEIWFELVRFELDKNNIRYHEIMKDFERFIKFGKESLYIRAEKLEKPIIPDAP